MSSAPESIPAIPELEGTSAMDELRDGISSLDPQASESQEEFVSKVESLTEDIDRYLARLNRASD